MRQSFTIELTDDEVATVRHLAALTGQPVVQIVRELHRRHIWFQLLVGVTAKHGVMVCRDGSEVAMPAHMQEWEFRKMADSLGFLIPRS